MVGQRDDETLETQDFISIPIHLATPQSPVPGSVKGLSRDPVEEPNFNQQRSLAHERSCHFGKMYVPHGSYHISLQGCHHGCVFLGRRELGECGSWVGGVGEKGLFAPLGF